MPLEPAGPNREESARFPQQVTAASGGDRRSLGQRGSRVHQGVRSTGGGRTAASGALDLAGGRRR
jgi:hypothetical protein